MSKKNDYVRRITESMSKKARQQQARGDEYMKALISESLQDLGERIHTFRNLSNGVRKKSKNLDGETIAILDKLYQTALDEIFDALSNAGDLKAGNVACDGIAKSMLVRRGFIERTKTSE